MRWAASSRARATRAPRLSAARYRATRAAGRARARPRPGKHPRAAQKRPVPLSQDLENEHRPAISGDLPLARIKQIMKQDACFDLRMIGADAVPTIALASELFIESLTLRAWGFAQRLGWCARARAAPAARAPRARAPPRAAPPRARPPLPPLPGPRPLTPRARSSPPLAQPRAPGAGPPGGVPLERQVRLPHRRDRAARGRLDPGGGPAHRAPRAGPRAPPRARPRASGAPRGRLCKGDSPLCNEPPAAPPPAPPRSPRAPPPPLRPAALGAPPPVLGAIHGRATTVAADGRAGRRAGDPPFTAPPSGRPTSRPRSRRAGRPPRRRRRRRAVAAAAHAGGAPRRGLLPHGPDGARPARKRRRGAEDGRSTSPRASSEPAGCAKIAPPRRAARSRGKHSADAAARGGARRGVAA